MTWPTTTINTTHMDAGTDLPSLARADIKQMADNVNAIKDTISITDPAAGEFLSYNSTSTQFENRDLFGVANQWGKQQYINLSTLTDGATVYWNLDYQVAELTLGGNRVMAAPTNKKAGATYVLIVKQPAGANYTLSFTSDYKFSGGDAPTITAANGAIDILTFISDGTYLYGGYIQDMK